MRDLALVARLRWRELHGQALYWLRVLGYEPAARTLSDRLYDVYLAVLGGGWGIAMLALAVQSAAQLGRMLPPEVSDALLAGLPWLVVAGQAVAAAGTLRSSPLKLTFPDMAYVAGTPLARGAVALVAWGLALARVLLVTAFVAALAAVALAQRAAPGAVEGSAILAVGVALPLAALTSGAAWCLGLARVAAPRFGGRRFVWLAPALLVPLAGLLPGVLLWPGWALAQAVAGQGHGVWALLLWLPVVPLAALVAWLGGRLHMADVAAESQTYARIRALGMATWWARDAVQSIHRQAALATRGRWMRLPVAWGTGAPAARVALGLVRQPSALLPLLLWGGVVAELASWVVGAAAYPPQWTAWLIFVMLAPPGALAGAFRADARNPFLRQLLPAGNLRLLVADVALPWAVLVASAMACWLVRWPAPGVAALGTLGIVALATLLALCQGVSLVRVRYLARGIPYGVAAGVAFGAVIGAGALTESPLAGLAVASALVVLLAALIERGRMVAGG